MASISTDKNGNRRILFVGADGKRRPLRLGKMPLKAVESIKTHVDDLVVSKMAGRPMGRPTAAWLADLDAWMLNKLAAVGLVARSEPKTVQTMEAFVDNYIAKRTDVKLGTLANYRQARSYLLKFFGGRKPIHEISAGDAEDWKRWMADQGLGENTARKWASCAKLFFAYAVRHKWIAESPFSALSSHTLKETSRYFFVTHDMAEKVLEACPDAEWRLIFAMARYGGLRCPSELLELRWGDVDWDHDRFCAHSPKTEGHEGHELRFVPIFPELRPYLEALFELAEPGTEYIINRYRSANQNLRTQLQKIIRRAGLTPWPKPFQNLRSSRETELMETFPAHVVCAWIGNSEAVARKHYLQVTDDHFSRATWPADDEAQKAARKQAQQAPAKVRNASHDEKLEMQKPAKNGPLRMTARDRKSLLRKEVPLRGVEPRFSD